MKKFIDFVIAESLLSDNLIGRLKELLKEQNEIVGYIKGDSFYILNKNKGSKIWAGNAEELRSIDADYFFHTHPRKTDVPYPSGDDIVATYLTNKINIVVCLDEIWSIAPLKSMPWQDVEEISNKLKQKTNNDYWAWKEEVKKVFPVRINLVSRK